MGWSPGGDQEIFSREELIEKFDVSRLHTAGAVFDEEKFKWMNATHLRNLPHQKLWSLLKPLFEKENISLPESEEFIDKSLSIFKTKMETLLDAIELFRPIDPKYFEVGEEAQEVMAWESSPQVFEAWKSELKKINSMYLTAEEFESVQNQVKDVAGVKGKHLFMPIRVAVIGKPHGADLKMLIPLIERESLLKRVDQLN